MTEMGLGQLVAEIESERKRENGTAAVVSFGVHGHCFGFELVD